MVPNPITFLTLPIRSWGSGGSKASVQSGQSTATPKSQVTRQVEHDRCKASQDKAPRETELRGHKRKSEGPLEGSNQTKKLRDERTRQKSKPASGDVQERSRRTHFQAKKPQKAKTARKHRSAEGARRAQEARKAQQARKAEEARKAQAEKPTSWKSRLLGFLQIMDSRVNSRMDRWAQLR